MPLSVLVIEDEKDWRDALCQMYRDILAADAPDVLPAKSVADAVELLRAKRFDLISVDIILEEGDGRAVLRKASELEATGGVVVVTGMDHNDNLRMLMKEGERVERVRMTLHAALNRLFPGRNLYLKKAPNFSVQENIGVYKDEVGRGQLLEVSGARNVFCKDGQTWLVRFMGSEMHLKDLVGFERIHYLLLKQGQEIPAHELVDVSVQREPGIFDERRRGMSAERLGEEGLHVTGYDRGIASADSQALSEYREHKRKIERRLKEIDSRIAELRKEDAEDAKVKGLELKKEELLRAKKHLNKQLGFKGRGKKEDNTTNKQRDAMSTSLDRSFKAIRKVHSALADHLRKSITLWGFTLCYNPEDPMDWSL